MSFNETTLRERVDGLVESRPYTQCCHGESSRYPRAAFFCGGLLSAWQKSVILGPIDVVWLIDLVMGVGVVIFRFGVDEEKRTTGMEAARFTACALAHVS